MGKSGRRWDGGEGILLPAKVGMQRRNLTLLLLAALCGGLIAWVAWPATADPLPPTVVPIEVAPSPVTSRPLPTVEQDPQQPPLPAGAPRVVVAVQALATYLPPPAPRVVVTEAGSTVPLPVTIVAGVGANSFVESVRPGLALVAIELGGGARLLRQVAVEAREVVAVGLGPRRMVRGTIQDARQQPLAGAQVSLGELDASGAVRAVTTNAEGHFELDTQAGVGVPLVVQAEGHAAQWRVLHVVEVGENSVVVGLPDEGLVEVQLACEALQIDAARVFVTPGSVVATELAQWPFFLQVLSRGAAVDDKGRAVLRGLPRTGTIGLVVLHPGAVLGGPFEVKLAGPRTPVIVPLSLQALSPARIVDEQGQPIAGATVLLRSARGSVPAGASLRLLPPLLDAVGCTVAFGADDGTFAIAGAARPDAVLSVRAPGHGGRDLPFTPALLTAPIVLPQWRSGEPSLHLLPPRAAARWRSEWNLSGGLQLVHEADAGPTVALPHAGRFEVIVTTFVGEAQRGTQTLVVDATGPVDVLAPKLD